MRTRRVARHSDWVRIKSSYPRGKKVDVVADREIGLGFLCSVGRQRHPGILRWREVSWNPAEQKQGCLAVGASFQAVVVGYDDMWSELVLSKKAAEPSAFDNLIAFHKVGTIVDGVVARVLDGGFVLRLEGDIEAFLPKDQVPPTSRKAIERLKTSESLLAGDDVRVAIKEIRPEERRIIVSVTEFFQKHERDVEREIEETRNAEVATPPLFGGGASDSPPAPRPGRLTVAILEDNGAVLSEVRWTLEERGHRVLAASSLLEIERLAAREPRIDVALMDLQLASGSGGQASTSLRQRHAGVRLFAFTGNPDLLAHTTSEEKGSPFDGVIVKPVDMSVLISYVEGRGIPPPHSRMWRLDEALQSFMRGDNNSESEEDSREINNSILDPFLEAACEQWPGARAAVLSLNEAANLVKCLRATGTGMSSAYLAKFESVLAFTRIGNVLQDGQPQIRKVDLVGGREDPKLVSLMGPLNSWKLLGFPMHVESFPDPLGLFVFGPPHEDRVDAEAIGAIRNIANSMANGIERSLLDVEVVRHQRATCASSLILGMTHEIRNALQNIEGARHRVVSLATSGDDERHQSVVQAVSEMGQQVKSLKETLELFLGVVRLEHTQQESLDKILWETVNACQRVAAQEGILLAPRLRLGEPVPHVPNILRQAILNIVLNAIQHTAASRERNGMVTVRMETAHEDGRRFTHIYVTDNGWGMHAVHRARVFEPFFTTRRMGSGLGLYVTRLIVQSLGGEVSIEESTRFVGTTVCVRLPFGSAKGETNGGSGGCVSAKGRTEGPDPGG